MQPTHTTSRLTGCLDDGATSKLWEDEWLQSGWVRLRAQSQDQALLFASHPNIYSYRVFSNRKLSSCAWRAGRLKPGSSLHSVNSAAHRH